MGRVLSRVPDGEAKSVGIPGHVAGLQIRGSLGRRSCRFRLYQYLKRVHFKSRGYVGLQSGNAPESGASGPNCQTTVSKLDAVIRKQDGECLTCSHKDRLRWMTL